MAEDVGDSAGQGSGHRRQRYRCPARRNVLSVIRVRQELPTRFVIPAGGAPGALALLGRDRLPPGGHGPPVRVPPVSVPEREHRGLLGVRRQGLRSPRRGSWYFSAELPSAAGEKWPVQATKCRPSLQQWSSAVGSITP